MVDSRIAISQIFQIGRADLKTDVGLALNDVYVFDVNVLPNRLFVAKHAFQLFHSALDLRGSIFPMCEGSWSTLAVFDRYLFRERIIVILTGAGLADVALRFERFYLAHDFALADACLLRDGLNRGNRLTSL